MEHDCKYEYRWGRQTQAMDDIKESVMEIKDCASEIKKTVGNMSDIVAVNRSSVNRLWYFVGAIILTIIAAAVYIIRVGTT